MKKALIATLVILAVLAAASAVFASAAGATPSAIQAILSPDIMVKYNGVVQVMKDANGNVVYPIMYNGTTYLPVRAVSNMLGIDVNWVNETRTVELGATATVPTSFLSATGPGTKTTAGNTSKWVKTTDKGELPSGRGDFGNRLAAHSEAIKTDSVYMSQQTRTVFKLDKQYKTLGFTLYNCAKYTATVQIADYVTKKLLWSCELEVGGSVYIADIDISSAQEIEFSAQLRDTPSGTRHVYNAIYICDPIVR